ncbi:chemotaxis protein CheD [Deltaproteobacteria bacterium OttesenSCG-928-M10]|nr:chemotaxis protein CheD [Deltaproteobacteria bacterium OttesenSCG-928-M10]
MNKDMEISCYHLEPGRLLICGVPTMISAVLGSSVAVCLYDRRLKIGGLSHFLYPRARPFGRGDRQYATVAIPAILAIFQNHGSLLEDLEAQIFGGGRPPGRAGYVDMGGKNIKMARRMLKKAGIPVISEDVGGIQGRRIIFHTRTNEVLVLKTRRVRSGDYYPYRQRIDG